MPEKRCIPVRSKTQGADIEATAAFGREAAPGTAHALPAAGGNMAMNAVAVTPDATLLSLGQRVMPGNLPENRAVKRSMARFEP
ncbi:hypothetical protein AA0535_0379 [Asaia krungthepensis NRIC 0535]|uniref:Uncharacterized protein n=1 Tax=Asaia krungthepensis NRIC 0535 TaxID=1307925 RepID=A0ABQ0PXF7_9PROT|nr:hypothetical protein AA0535_0379 [Asaia krungthepensis NRIC 0535]